MKNNRMNRRHSRAAALKQTLLITVVAAVSAITGQAGIFPAMDGDIAVSIPFQFVAAGQTMQAGEYIVRHDSTRGVIEICEDGVYCVSVPARTGTASAVVESPELVFEHCRKRETFVLAGVSSPSRGRIQVGSAEQSPTAAGSVSEKCVPARELCLHRNQGSAPSWH